MIPAHFIRPFHTGPCFPWKARPFLKASEVSYVRPRAELGVRLPAVYLPLSYRHGLCPGGTAGDRPLLLRLLLRLPPAPGQRGVDRPAGAPYPARLFPSAAPHGAAGRPPSAPDHCALRLQRLFPVGLPLRPTVGPGPGGQRLRGDRALGAGLSYQADVLLQPGDRKLQSGGLRRRGDLVHPLGQEGRGGGCDGLLLGRRRGLFPQLRPAPEV